MSEMTTPVKKKEDSIAKLGLILFVITFCVAALLGVVNSLTKDQIAYQAQLEIQNAIASIYPEAAETEELSLPESVDPARISAIYAAYDGKVVAATYSSTMGNYVMIDHGSEIYTIYMHASALYVKKGDIVIRGETIAGVGTTGRSTGNHLHFSVRKSGEYQSPWDYISKP